MTEPPIDPTLEALYLACRNDPAVYPILGDWLEEQGNDKAAAEAREGRPYEAVTLFLPLRYGYYSERSAAVSGTAIWVDEDDREIGTTGVYTLPRSISIRYPGEEFVGMVKTFVRRIDRLENGWSRSYRGGQFVPVILSPPPFIVGDV